MPIEKADFVAVPSTDWERTRAFYVETLGLRGDEKAQAEFWVGDQCFAIWEPERVGGTFEPQRNGHIAFHVDDIETSRAEVAKFAAIDPPCHSSWRDAPEKNATYTAAPAARAPPAA